MVELCQTFGWTYQELKDTPLEFIELIIEKIKVDRRKNKKN